MAKRAPVDEIAYCPLDMTLAQSVVKGAGKAVDDGTMSGDGAGGSVSASSTQGSTSTSSSQFVAMASRHQQITSVKADGVRSLNREKRVLLTPEEERQIERLVDRIGEQLGSSLKLSHLLRACMALLCHSEREIIRHTTGLHSLPRPANNDAVALAQYEHALAKLLSKSLRDTPEIR